MKYEKYNEQRYYERAIFYGDLIPISTRRMFKPITHQKTWLMSAGLIESADMIEYNEDE
ncbi:hypothetical protein LCGC14_1062190 [marine sediment metagenome]|uniref:Uncharacterized protein n=1 Tax=marine sediment metagenome TaxID=412755 RepID=A0A0F9MQC3_9ZZZZ